MSDLFRVFLCDKSVFLGFNPGGSGNFGVAMLHGTEIKAATVGSVADAMTWAVAECEKAEPIAAGIDTLLH